LQDIKLYVVRSKEKVTVKVSQAEALLFNLEATAGIFSNVIKNTLQSKYFLTRSRIMFLYESVSMKWKSNYPSNSWKKDNPTNYP